MLASKVKLSSLKVSTLFTQKLSPWQRMDCDCDPGWYRAGPPHQHHHIYYLGIVYTIYYLLSTIYYLLSTIYYLLQTLVWSLCLSLVCRYFAYTLGWCGLLLQGAKTVSTVSRFVVGQGRPYPRSMHTSYTMYSMQYIKSLNCTS